MEGWQPDKKLIKLIQNSNSMAAYEIADQS